MGYDAIVRLQRRVTRADETTRDSRYRVILCGQRDECTLPPAIMLRVAKMLPAKPLGGKAFVTIKWDEHIFASQKRWGELHGEYLALQTELKAQLRANPDQEVSSASVEDKVAEAAGFSPQKLTGMLDGRQWFLHQLFSDRRSRRKGRHASPVLSCVVPGLPHDTLEEYANPFKDGGWGEDGHLEEEDGYGTADEHDHCFAYLDGLLAVDWSVDYLSTLRGGFRAPSIVCNEVCAWCNTPTYKESGWSHNCPDQRADEHRKPSPFGGEGLYTGVAGPIIGLSVDKGCQEIQRQDSGALGGKTRREYCLGSGDPMEASTDCTNFLSLFAKYREQFEVHGASAGDFRVIMFFNC